MSATQPVRRERKPRGAAKNRKALYLEIDPASIAKLEVMADSLGRSKARTLDLVLASIDVDASGRPAFWQGPLASELQEELPIASAS